MNHIGNLEGLLHCVECGHANFHVRSEEADHIFVSCAHCGEKYVSH